MGMNFMLHK